MAKDIFESNPALKEYFETSDGQKFHTREIAEAYAKRLSKDKRDVSRVERPENQSGKQASNAQKAKQNAAKTARSTKASQEKVSGDVQIKTTANAGKTKK